MLSSILASWFTPCKGYMDCLQAQKISSSCSGVPQALPLQVTLLRATWGNPFAALQVSATGDTVGPLSPPSTHTSEVSLLMLWPRIQLSSVLRPGVTARVCPAGSQAEQQGSCCHTAAFQRGTGSSQGSVIPCVHVKANTGRQP